MFWLFIALALYWGIAGDNAASAVFFVGAVLLESGRKKE